MTFIMFGFLFCLISGIGSGIAVHNMSNEKKEGTNYRIIKIFAIVLIIGLILIVAGSTQLNNVLVVG